MSRPRLLGGYARRNGVTLIGLEHTAQAMRARDGRVEVRVRKSPGLYRLLLRGEDIPVLRSLALLVFITLMQAPLLLVLIALSIWLVAGGLEKLPWLAPLEGSQQMMSLFIGGVVGGSVGALIAVRLGSGQYHGAEHKALSLHRAGLEPSLEAARAQPRVVPQCGGSLMTLFVIALVALAPVPGLPFWLYAAAAWLLAAEAFYLQLNHPRLAWLGAPGAWLQKHLTTLEPEESHLEVALAALRGVRKGREGTVWEGKSERSKRKKKARR